jgi:cell wall-associated NlpC family hydrolase
MRYLIPVLLMAILTCSFNLARYKSAIAKNTTIPAKNIVLTDPTTNSKADPATNTIADNEGSTEFATGFVAYAKTLIGTPYVYGSVNPRVGLDCSGFVNCVSNHFGIKVPRSSVQFTNVGTTIETNDAQPGDLILFTGTDPRKHEVGHMGIITGNHDGQVQFIHSSSGKAKGVIITDLDDYYKTRLVKVIRIFPLTPGKVIS